MRKTMSDGTNKTVIVGFDALDFRYLDRFADDLPHFAALRDDGVEAPLRSTFPPWTGSAWPSMYTGMDPSHHGVYGFFHHGGRYPEEADLVTRNHVKAPALWNYLSADEVPSVVLNVPVTHPADETDGVLVPGYLAPEDEPGSPASIRDELDVALESPYRIYSRAELSDDGDEKLAGYLDLIDHRADAAVHLLETHEWEVAFVQVQKTDAVFHNFSDEAAFREIYRRADDLLGRVIETAENPNVIVCSDHGIGPVDGYNVYINEFLKKHGYVETTTEKTGATLIDEKQNLTDGEGGGGGETPRSFDESVTATVTALTGVLRHAGITPGDVYALAQRVGLGSVLTELVPSSALDSVGEGVDWRRSTAYCRGSTELGIRLNVEGREPEGTVGEEEYEAVRDELVQLLSNLRTPDGEPAFDFVEHREELYDGPYAEDAPDILFKPRNMNNIVMTNLVGREFVAAESFDHQAQGVFIGTGPAFEAGADVDSLSLTDVAPIALAAAGCHVPQRMTGDVPDGLLGSSVTRADYGEIRYGTDMDDGVEEGQVAERLDDLGYL